MSDILIPTEAELTERGFKYVGPRYKLWTGREDEYPVKAIYYYPGGDWKISLRMEWADIYPTSLEELDTLLEIIKIK